MIVSLIHACRENIPRARRELTNLTKYSTPMGKMLCIRRVIVALMQPPKRNHKSSPEHDHGELQLSGIRNPDPCFDELKRH